MYHLHFFKVINVISIHLFYSIIFRIFVFYCLGNSIVSTESVYFKLSFFSMSLLIHMRPNLTTSRSHLLICCNKIHVFFLWNPISYHIIYSHRSHTWIIHRCMCSKSCTKQHHYCNCIKLGFIISMLSSISILQPNPLERPNWTRNGQSHSGCGISIVDDNNLSHTETVPFVLATSNIQRWNISFPFHSFWSFSSALW